MITLTVGWGCFNSAAFRPILSFWTLLGYFWESGSGSKTFLGPTHLDYQLWFWKSSRIVQVGIKFKNFLETYLYRLSTLLLEAYSYPFAPVSPHFGHKALFRPCWAIFGGGIKFKNFLGTYLHSLATFIFEVQLYFACKILFRMVGSGQVVRWGLRLKPTQPS